MKITIFVAILLSITCIAYVGCSSNSSSQVASSGDNSTDGVVLPKPAPPFGGTIGRTVKESKPDFPKAVAARQGRLAT